jgi:sugar lactone lactonase YvrE
MHAGIRSSLIIGLLAMAVAGLPAAAQDDHVFIRGAPIAGSSNGLAIDADGNLAVANVWGGTITLIDPADGTILEVHGRESSLGMPDDVAFAPDGTLHFTQEGPAGGVARISPDGQVSAVAALPFANPVAITADDQLVVAQCFGPENGLYVLDPAGESEPRLVMGGIPGCAMNAFDLGPDGLLYGPNPPQGTLSAVDLDSGETTVVLDGLAFPVAIEFDSQGRLHYADQATGAVYRMAQASGSVETLAQLDVGLDNLTFDTADRLHVSNAVDGSITEVLPDGTTRVVSPGGMTAPAGIAVVGDTLYVAEPQDIRAYDRRTGAPAGLVPSVFGVSELGSPITIAADGEQVITTSWFDNSVRVVEWPSGEAVAVYTDFAAPVIALRFQGDLIVAELGTSSIVRADGGDPSQRQTLATLVVPGGLAASDDDLYASDWATGTVYQLVADSETLAEPLVVGEGLSFPEGLAIAPDGALLIVETGTRDLVALDPATGETRVVADGLAVELPPPQGFPMPPTFWFNGVAVADDGTVYVGGRADNVIYRYEVGA